MNLAEFRCELSEGGVIQALRDVYDFYFAATGESYIKTSDDEKYRVFGATPGICT